MPSHFELFLLTLVIAILAHMWTMQWRMQACIEWMKFEDSLYRTQLAFGDMEVSPETVAESKRLFHACIT